MILGLCLSLCLTSCIIQMPSQSTATQESQNQQTDGGKKTLNTKPTSATPGKFEMITIPGDFNASGSVITGKVSISSILNMKITDINKIGLQFTKPKFSLKGNSNQFSGNEDDFSPFALTEKDVKMPVLEHLGHGYDVFEKYASAKYVEDGAVLDLQKLLKDGKVYRRNIPESTYKIVTASSIKRYSKEVATQISLSGSYMFFSGSAKANFNSSHLEEANSYFSTIFYNIGLYKLYIDPAVNLKDYVKADALNVLETKDANFIFENYGTHVLRSVEAGGRFDYNTSVEKKYVKDEKSFSAQVKASFNAGFASAKCTVDNASTQISESFTENSITNIFTYGGDGIDGQSLANDVNALKKWLATVKKNPSISEFGDNGLIPIWEFCKTEARKKYLKAEFEKYAAKKMTMVPTGSVINGLRLSFSGPYDNINSEYTDPASGTWHYISNIASHGMDRVANLYARYTYDGDTKNPPIVEVILEDKTIGDDAVKYFNNKYKNDPTAKLWGLRGKYNISGSNLGTEINSPLAKIAGAHEIRLYYVTSERGSPIREIIFKHIPPDNTEHYLQHAPEEGRKYHYVPVLNDQSKYKDISEGAAASVTGLQIARRCYLLYTLE
jgi:hypothetical protein